MSQHRLGLRPKYLQISAHCRDLCVFSLMSDDNQTIIENDGYVPSDLGIGGGDDVELTIDLDSGMIVGWTRPSDVRLKKLVNKVIKGYDDEDEEDDDE